MAVPWGLGGIKSKYGHSFDWVWGLLVLGCEPFLVAYLGLPTANQAVRRCDTCPCSRPVLAGEGEEGEVVVDVFPERTHRPITTFHSWDCAKVFMYVVYLGCVLITLQVLIF